MYFLFPGSVADGGQPLLLLPQCDKCANARFFFLFLHFFSGSRYGLWTPTTIDANTLQTKSVVVPFL